MKTGKTLVELATEVERQAAAKRDYLADTRKLVLTADAKAVALNGSDVTHSYPLTRHAHGQLAEKIGMPRAFYDRLAADHPDVLSNTVNEMLHREPQKVMVRTLDNNARALVSNAFRTLDNYDLADAAIPALLAAGAEVRSSEITETKMYIKAVIPSLDRVVPLPPGMKWGEGHNQVTRALLGGITISNSEVGAGGLVVSPAMEERACTNLVVFGTSAMRAVHIGKRKDVLDHDVTEYLTAGTRRLEDAATWARLRDFIKAICDGRVMDNLVAQMTAARADAIEGDPAAVVEVIGKRLGITEGERGGLMRHLVDAGEATRYGLQWAVTRLAGDVEDYDRASELERIGGQIIELPRSEWQSILKQAA